jgi:hypothetical protein
MNICFVSFVFAKNEQELAGNSSRGFKVSAMKIIKLCSKPSLSWDYNF